MRNVHLYRRQQDPGTVPQPDADRIGIYERPDGEGGDGGDRPGSGGPCGTGLRRGAPPPTSARRPAAPAVFHRARALSDPRATMRT
ncbi:hypothetical protein GCM10017688_32470 [Streptomyces ramulosus]